MVAVHELISPKKGDPWLIYLCICTYINFEIVLFILLPFSVNTIRKKDAYKRGNLLNGVLVID
jgi:hypothetical protein